VSDRIGAYEAKTKQRRAAEAVEAWKRHPAKRPPIYAVDIKALVEFGRK